jgi:hypothetical protein
MRKPSRAVTRKCSACGHRFPGRKDAQYCSGACRQAAQRARNKTTDYAREIEAARLYYWRLVAEAALSRGVPVSRIVTEQAHYVDADGNVYQGFPGAGRLVGRTTPSQPGWAAWGSEAAGPPWDPPPPFRKPSKGQAARKGPTNAPGGAAA